MTPLNPLFPGVFKGGIFLCFIGNIELGRFNGADRLTARQHNFHSRQHQRVSDGDRKHGRIQGLNN